VVRRDVRTPGFQAMPARFLQAYLMAMHAFLDAGPDGFIQFLQRHGVSPRQ
jgi:hypothetical protein